VLLFWHGQQQRFELVFGYALENLGAVIRFPHHVQVKSAGKNLLQALADNRVVVGYESNREIFVSVFAIFGRLTRARK
jgi:hypothetical protein